MPHRRGTSVGSWMRTRCCARLQLVDLETRWRMRFPREWGSNYSHLLSRRVATQRLADNGVSDVQHHLFRSICSTCRRRSWLLGRLSRSFTCPGFAATCSSDHVVLELPGSPLVMMTSDIRLLCRGLRLFSLEVGRFLVEHLDSCSKKRPDFAFSVGRQTHQRIHTPRRRYRCRPMGLLEHCVEIPTIHEGLNVEVDMAATP